MCRKISNLYEASSVFNVCLSFTKQVNYKVSSIAKNLCTFVIAEQFDWSRKISLAITRQIAQEDINFLLTKTTHASRSSQEAVMIMQPLFVNEYKFKVGLQSSFLKNKFQEFAEENINIFSENPNHTPWLPKNMWVF